MSIGADWRQNSPGSVAGLTKDVASNKFANSGPGEQLVDGAQEGRDFSDYMFGEDGFEFSDVLDVINPLQHIPGVGMLYRSLTGDELGNGARVVGGGLFGGVFGLAGAAIDAVVDAVSGEDTGAHVMAFLEDSFNGAPTDDGTAVVDAAPSGADAPDAVTARADTIANASFDGTYQGDLVLPWMAGQASQGRPAGIAATAAEQSTIVQAAPVGGVEYAALDAGQQNAASTISGPKASDLNTPWAQATPAATMAENAPQKSAQASASAKASAQSTTALQEMAEAVQSDPAELAVAMASAGGNSPVSSLTRTTAATHSPQNGNNPIRPASFSSEGGDTVWARAQNSGRVSRTTNSFALSPEMVAHESRQAKQAAANVDAVEDMSGQSPSADQNALRENSVSPAQAFADFRNGGTPLSAAEMAAKFNAALGRDSSQAMAQTPVQDAVSSGNTPAAQGKISGSFNRDTSSNAAAQHEETAATPVVHPLMEQATSHIEGDAPVGAWFSQTMMDGLKKYQDMQQNRQNPANAI